MAFSARCPLALDGWQRTGRCAERTCVDCGEKDRPDMWSVGPY
jgi:hypothetical protein